MVRKITGVFALVVTLLGASYLSATPVAASCSSAIAAIEAVFEDQCGGPENWDCDFSCEGGALVEADCECNT